MSKEKPLDQWVTTDNQESLYSNDTEFSFLTQNPFAKHSEESLKTINRESFNYSRQLENEIRKVRSEIDREFKKFKDIDLENLKKEINLLKTNIIEIVGVFTAVATLVLGNVNILSNSESTLFDKALLSTFITLTVVVFITLLHHFFGTNSKNSWSGFVVTMIILVILVVLAFFLTFLNYAK